MCEHLLYLCILIELLIAVAYSIIFHEVAQTNLQSGDVSVAAFNIYQAYGHWQLPAS